MRFTWLALERIQAFFRGKEMTNVAIIIVSGKVTSMTGSGPGFDAMKKEYDAVSDPGKDLVSYIDFGINPNLKIWPASTVGNCCCTNRNAASARGARGAALA